MTRFLGSTLLALTLLAAATPAPAQGDFRSCLSGLRGQAAARGISAQAFDAATRGVEPDLSILDLMNNQPEFKTPIWDYLAALVDDERVQDGKTAMGRWGQALAAAEARFGVDRHAIAGVWGVESNFGKDIGGRPLVQSLSTLACYGPRRRDYFTGELMATLKIVQDGDMDASVLRGSWAGAFGHTQFMPSTFQRLAVDGDGDGRSDIWQSEPDALASIANYFAKSGWKPNTPWGVAVSVPSGFNRAAVANRLRAPRCPRVFERHSRWMSIGEWRRMGIQIRGNAPRDSEMASLIEPDGPGRTAYLLTTNYRTILDYNCSNFYALSVGLLADEVRR